MQYDPLEQNIIDAMEEQQLKLGYLPETVRFYYPLDSLNRFLKTAYTVEQMTEALKGFVRDVEKRLGTVQIRVKGERFEFAIPPEGAAYVHAHCDTDGFLAQLIAIVGRHGSTLEEVLACFRRFSENVHIEHMDNGEFDELVYFEEGVPDTYRYCISVEAGHVIYHRYTKEDYESFGF